MGVLKFTTKISKSGTIQLPPHSSLYNQEVDIIIMPKSRNRKAKKTNAAEFVRKWAGFLKNSDTEDAKFAYLSEKYQ